MYIPNGEKVIKLGSKMKTKYFKEKLCHDQIFSSTQLLCATKPKTNACISSSGN